MQQSSFQVASRTDQSDFKRPLRIIIFLSLLLAVVGIAALGIRANRAATNEAAGSSSRGAAPATSYSSQFSDGMPLP
jgi:hypothetical protein